MQVRSRTKFVLAMIIIAANSSAFAQQDSGPIVKPKTQSKPKASGGTILVVCDLACNWKLDGDAMGALEEGGSKKVSVSPGQHLVDAATVDNADKAQKEVDVQAGAQSIVRIELQPVRDVRVKAAQVAAEKVAQEQAAQQEAAQQRVVQEQEARNKAAREQAEREAAVQQQQEQQAAREQQTRPRPAVLERLMPNAGYKIPGTQWSFQSLGVSESGTIPSYFNAIGEIGSNARFVTWSINVQVEKNSAATEVASCRYFDSAGNAVSADMKAQLSLQAKNKGTYSFMSGSGNSWEHTWRPGEYQIRCEIEGTPFLRENFTVLSDPVFLLDNQKGVHNTALLILSDGQLAYTARDYLGFLRVSSDGVKFTNARGKSDFSATCSELTARVEKAHVKITHSGSTETLAAASPTYASAVLEAINSACRR